MSSSPAGTKQTEPKEQQTSQVRLEWRTVLLFGRPCFRASSLVGLDLEVRRQKEASVSKPWFGYVKTAGQRHDFSDCFASKKEAQLYCESVLKSLLVAELGVVMGENWTTEPNRLRIRMVCDVEYETEGDQYLLKSREIRNSDEFIIVTGLHEEHCAATKGSMCNCASLVAPKQGVGHA